MIITKYFHKKIRQFNILTKEENEENEGSVPQGAKVLTRWGTDPEFLEIINVHNYMSIIQSISF